MTNTETPLTAMLAQDPALRLGFEEPTVLAHWLERRRQCMTCPRLGRGALCAAELKWPDIAHGMLAMVTCADILRQGGRKPEHGLRKVGQTAFVGSQTPMTITD